MANMHGDKLRTCFFSAVSLGVREALTSYMYLTLNIIIDNECVV